MTDKKQLEKEIEELMLPLGTHMEQKIAELIADEDLIIKNGYPKTVGEYRLVARVYPMYGPEKAILYLPHRSLQGIRAMACSMKVSMSKELVAQRRKAKKNNQLLEEVSGVPPTGIFDKNSIEWLAMCGHRVERFVGRREGCPV